MFTIFISTDKRKVFAVTRVSQGTQRYYFFFSDYSLKRLRRLCLLHRSKFFVLEQSRQAKNLVKRRIDRIHQREQYGLPLGLSIINKVRD